MLDLQERMDRKILTIATPKSSVHLSMQKLREEHDEVLNTAEDNGAAVYQIAVTLIGSHNLLVTDGIWALD